MQLFKAVKAGATGSSSQPAGDTDNTITLAVVHSINVFLAAYVEGLPPQVCVMCNQCGFVCSQVSQVVSIRIHV